ncbi:MAG: ABC transporter substrate-binding protein [Methylobacteriaceae bacterium]|nr:ABC transporter substrate-binding protein [Methylobacteriaceae bacterium]
MRSLGLSLAAAACFFQLVSYSDAQAPQQVRAAYVPAVTWLPVRVAKDKGIFQKHGLDVSLTLIQNLSLLPGAVGKQFDFAASTGPDLLKAVASGLDVAAVAGEVFETKDNMTTQIVVRGDSPIKTLADLKGKIVGTPSLGAIIHVSLLHWLKKEGIDTSTIRAVEVPFPAMADQLKAGRIDAAEMIDPFSRQMIAAGGRSLGDPVLSVGDDVLFPFWISERSWAEKNPAILKAWIMSLEEAKAFIDANPEEARVVLSDYTKLPPAVVREIPFPNYRFRITAKDLAVWVDVLKSLGQLSADLGNRKLVVEVE